MRDRHKSYERFVSSPLKNYWNLRPIATWKCWTSTFDEYQMKYLSNDHKCIICRKNLEQSSWLGWPISNSELCCLGFFLQESPIFATVFECQLRSFVYQCSRWPLRYWFTKNMIPSISKVVYRSISTEFIMKPPITINKCFFGCLEVIRLSFFLETALGFAGIKTPIFNSFRALHNKFRCACRYIVSNVSLKLVKTIV